MLELLTLVVAMATNILKSRRISCIFPGEGGGEFHQTNRFLCGSNSQPNQSCPFAAGFVCTVVGQS